MRQPSDYAVVRVNDDSYRLDRTTPPPMAFHALTRAEPLPSSPGIGAVAFVRRFRDRLGYPIGWRLKSLVVMQGAKSRIHPTAAEAFASTKLLSPKQARKAVKQADGGVLADAGSARR